MLHQKKEPEQGSALFHVLVLCWDVNVSRDHKGSKFTARRWKSHAAHHGGKFIYKPDSWGAAIGHPFVWVRVLGVVIGSFWTKKKEQ